MHTYNSKQPRQCGRQAGRHNRPNQPKNRVKTRTTNDMEKHVVRSVEITHKAMIRARKQWILQGGKW